jgi:type I restriction enzyme S subunit
MVKKNEILMAAYRHIGKVNRNMEGAYNVALIKFKTRDPQTLSEDFLYDLIPSKYIREELLKVSERAHIPSTSLEIINNLHIPIPPLKVQSEIVDSFNSNVETLERIQQIKMKAQLAILKTIASLWEV